MSDLLIRNLDPDLKRRLLARARKHGRSLSEEAKSLLRRAVFGEKSKRGLGTELAHLFQSVGGLDLDIPRDERPRKPPSFK